MVSINIKFALIVWLSVRLAAFGEQTTWQVEFASSGVSALKLNANKEIGNESDVQDQLNYLLPGRQLGDLHVVYRVADGDWNQSGPLQVSETTKESGTSNDSRVVPLEAKRHPQFRSYDSQYGSRDTTDLMVRQSFNVSNQRLLWNLELRNLTTSPLEIGDLAIPYVFNTQGATYDTRLYLHRWLSGHGSFLYWVRASGAGNRLVMSPTAGTSLEYFDSDRLAYIHSKVAGQNEQRGSWRQPHTSAVISPGQSLRYGFQFDLAKDDAAVRDVLYENELFDVHVVPGMVVPLGLTAKFVLRTKHALDGNAISVEHPGQTQVSYLGKSAPDTHLYEVNFERLGENQLTVHYGHKSMLYLDFFVTQSLETVIKKRAAFIVGNQQHRDKTKWYDGLFSLWDMKQQELLGPDNTGGLEDYVVGGSDDPSNGKAAYVSEKNAHYPDPREIESLEYYLQNFVWGKLQRTDREHPYPYGIYGSENWHLNRTTEWGTTNESRIAQRRELFESPQGTGLGQERLWRTFDYTTFIMLYYNMYQIARQNPELTDYLDADGYLRRAYGTAKAFFEVPYSIYMPGKPLWSFKGYCDWAYKQGNFHEKYLLPLMDALESKGWQTEADYLRREWEKKVKYFLYDDSHPFGSEFPFDRTAFESTYAIASYALDNRMSPDQRLWYDKNLKKWYSHPIVVRRTAVDFLNRQLAANLAQRGCLEASYHQLGSARCSGRSHLGYMSQMAGWSVFDHARRYSKKPYEQLRLGYAALLSSWALVNCGDAQSDFGYWFPGEKNDGAAGCRYSPSKWGRTWMHTEEPRGAWRFDSDIDHGFAGGIHAAATIVMDDPLFGMTSLGGRLKAVEDGLSVLCRDGVRRRIFFVADDLRFGIELERDGFAKNVPVVLKPGLAETPWADQPWTISFAIENRLLDDHGTYVMVRNLPGRYSAAVNGEAVNVETAHDGTAKFQVNLTTAQRIAHVEVRASESGTVESAKSESAKDETGKDE